MNRKQRRAKKVKNTEPVYCLKSSDIKGHIDNIIDKDPAVQKAIQEEARRVNLEEARAVAEDTDARILMSLHTVFGFGKTRLLRFYKGLIDLHLFYQGRYEDCDTFAMKQYLKDKVGIDVSELQKEIDKIVEESAD